MVKVREAIVVEGKYDKNTLSQIVDAVIFQTDGFSIFHNPQQLKMLRQVAQKRGLIVFTDSDGAGFVIRNHLKSAIPPQYIKHAYIPDIPGKERRKSAPGKEGKLGVEGMTPQIILDALRRSGATLDDAAVSFGGQITKQDFADFGLSGGKDSSILRKKVQKKLDLPLHLSANGLLQAVNLLYTKEEFASVMEEMEKDNG